MTTIDITIRAPNIGTVKHADATSTIQVPRTWYDALKATQPSKQHDELAALGLAVFKSLQAIELAALVRTIYKDGLPAV